MAPARSATSLPDGAAGGRIGYHIPEVYVTGDGRIVRVTRDSRSRDVPDGLLAPEELQAVFETVVELGFTRGRTTTTHWEELNPADVPARESEC